jgi:hypothetical protein
MNRQLYDRAMFWLALAAVVFAVGAVLLAYGNHALGWTIVGVACVSVLVAIALYFWRKRQPPTRARFEVVSAEWRCVPPLNHSPIYANRDCTALIVLVNRGDEGNAVLVVRFTGIGRAGNEFPRRERRIVVPRTAPSGYVEVECHVGQMSPVYIADQPEIEIVQG